MIATGGRLASRYPRRGGVQVSELQRSRMLSSVVQVVSEHGYDELSVTRVTGRAGVSRRTFYELFENREACFLAAFEEAVAEMGWLASSAYADEGSWRESVRAALLALLKYLDENPPVASLVIVQALGAGPRMLERRAEILSALTSVIERGRAESGRRAEAPPLTGEGVVGAVVSVVHARLVENSGAPLLGLLNSLMSVIVAPYLGHAVAARELRRANPIAPHAPRAENPLSGLKMRLTYRTVRVLAVIAEQPGASNREVAGGAGVSDQGQISKLLTRLESLGLVENTSPGQPSGEPNQWHLTPHGQQIQQATQSRRQATQSRAASDRGAHPSNHEERSDECS